jgi:hypothetical protein
LLHLVLKSACGRATDLVVLRAAPAFEKLSFEVATTAGENRTF